MRFAESRIIKVARNLNSGYCISLSEIDIAFFHSDLNGTIPEAINIEFGSTKNRLQMKHIFFDVDGINWQIDNDSSLNKVFDEWILKEGDSLIFQKIGPIEYILTPLWQSFTFIDLFAGIGGIRLGFEAVKGKCVFSSEWDKLAQDTYEANFGDRPAGDLTKLDEKTIPNHEILVGGFPCQPFSIIGNRSGFADTRGTLFFEIERILRYHRPVAILLENVKQFRTHDQGRTCQTVLDTLKSIGYNTHVSILNALDYGVAQKRERTFIVGFLDDIHFEFPKPHTYKPKLDDILESEENVDKSLIASEMIQMKRVERVLQQGKTPFYPSIWHENKGGHIGMHPFSCALRHNASYNYLLVNGKRRPTGREMLRLLGYPENYKIVVDHMAIRAQAGNSVAVPVITSIAAQMSLALRMAKRNIVKENQGVLFA